MKITKKIEELFGYAQQVIDGFLNLCKTTDLPKAVGEAASTALTVLREKDAEFRVALTLALNLDAALAEISREAEAVLAAATKVLRFKVSERWSPVWGEAGYLDQSTQIPDKALARVELLNNLAKFFAKRTEWQDAENGLTVENLKKVSAALKTAYSAVEKHGSKQKTLLTERNRLATRLQTRLRTLVAELKQVLAKDDPRWAELGLPTPEADRAAQPARARKAKEKSQAFINTRAVAARRRAEDARGVAERAAFRAEKAVSAAQKLQAEANQAAAKAATLLDQAVALESEANQAAGYPQRAVTLSKQTATSTSDSQELGDSALIG